MTSIPRLGHRCSNQYARLILQSLIEVAGENGMRAVCRLAGLAALIDDLPPENEAREFDHSDLAAIFQTLNEIFGSHGSRSLAFKAGQMTVVSMLETYGANFEVGGQPQPEIPMDEKVDKGLEGVRFMLLQVSDQQVDLMHDETSGAWWVKVRDCPICQGRESAEPVCAFTEGMLDQAVFQFSGGSKFQVREMDCIAAGGDACRFLVQIPKPENPPFTV